MLNVIFSSFLGISGKFLTGENLFGAYPKAVYWVTSARPVERMNEGMVLRH